MKLLFLKACSLAPRAPYHAHPPTCLEQVLKTPVSSDMLGRVFNGSGRPIDGGWVRCTRITCCNDGTLNVCHVSERADRVPFHPPRQATGAGRDLFGHQRRIHQPC